MKLLPAVPLLLSLAATSVAALAQTTSKPIDPDPGRTTGSAWEEQKFEEALHLIHIGVGTRGGLDKAYRVLEEINGRNPRSPYLLAAAAELQYLSFANDQGVTADEVRALCHRALQLKPDMPDPYVVLAKVEVHVGDPFAANQAADTALRLAPNKREAWYAKAKAEEAAGNLDAAEQWLRKALDAHTHPSRKSNMYGALSELYQKQKPPDPEKIVAAYRQSADLDPQHPWKRAQVASLLNTYTERYDEAIAQAQQSLKVQDTGQGQRQLAIALYGKWASAYLDGSLANGKVKTPAPDRIALETRFSSEQMLQNAGYYKAGLRVTTALLKAGLIKDVDARPDMDCCTALLVAAHTDNLELARLLIAHGANVHAADPRDQRTPLFQFALGGNLKAVDFLLERGARVNVADKYSGPLTHVLVEVNKPELTPVLERLLAAGADPELPDDSGGSLLATAAGTNNTAVLELLLKRYKLDPNATDGQGNPALTLAVNSGGRNRARNVKMLLDAGANPWIKWGAADALESVEVSQAHSPAIFPEHREIAILLRDARKRVPRPQGFPEWKPTAAVSR